MSSRGSAAARAARIELASHAWARRDAMARQALDAADAARIGCREQLFAALGFAREEARRRGFLLYCDGVAESLLHRTAAQRQARAAFVEGLMRQPLA